MCFVVLGSEMRKDFLPGMKAGCTCLEACVLPVAMMKLYYAMLILHELSPRDHMFRLDTRKKRKLFLKVKLESIVTRFAELY